MARTLRVEFEGAIHHVTLRGAERRPIFTADSERERFLARLADEVETHGVRVYMFCLMGNHVHLVVETPRANLGRFMHGLQTAYTVYFNLRHQRAGHLMQGRYGAVLVEGNDYLLKLTRYVHLNPVCVKSARGLALEDRIRLLRDYRWSSYRGYVGKDKPLDFVEYGPVLALLGVQPASRKRAYQRFVETGLAESDEEFRDALKASRLSLGSEDFQARIRDLHTDLAGQHRRPEDTALRKMGRAVPVDRVLSVVCEVLGVKEEECRRHRRASWVRPVAATMLCKHAGLTQREAADALGVTSGAAVCSQVRRLRDGIRGDRRLVDLVGVIEKRLLEEPVN